MDGDPTAAMPHFTHSRPAGPWQQYILSAELFVLAHEMSHLLRGHMVNREAGGVPLEVGGDRTMSFSHEQEYEADATGLRIMLRTAEERDAREVSSRYVGCELFLKGGQILYRAALASNYRPRRSCECSTRRTLRHPQDVTGSDWRRKVR